MPLSRRCPRCVGRTMHPTNMEGTNTSCPNTEAPNLPEFDANPLSMLTHHYFLHKSIRRRKPPDLRIHHGLQNGSRQGLRGRCGCGGLGYVAHSLRESCVALCSVCRNTDSSPDRLLECRKNHVQHLLPSPAPIPGPVLARCNALGIRYPKHPRNDAIRCAPHARRVRPSR